MDKEKLKKAAQEAWQMLASCEICPRRCKVNRLKDERGFCKTGLRPKVCSTLPHHGEEPPISGTRGSGTIFFTHCNMACVYCQNYEFSQLGQGREVSTEELAGFMLQLQREGCHNINLVTPTHVMPQILKALETAVKEGLNIPLVYNSGGYELSEILKLLEGLVDIYLPDMRYGDANAALAYSQAPDYPRYNQAAVKEMHRQVGAQGLIIRHLVLPHGLSGTEQVMKFIAEELGPETPISLMSQYLPYYKAKEFPAISRRLKDSEYETAKQIMEKYGLHNGWVQESYGLERFAGVHIKPNLIKDGQE
jgi:putative pyruvate formate lyase activating enzyme